LSVFSRPYRHSDERTIPDVGAISANQLKYEVCQSTVSFWAL
jgi:hypothetical protein